MARILVLGHVHHDRVWRLDRPLVSGARLHWQTRETRLGGGGFNTASALRNLGHDVVLATALTDDAGGHAAIAALRRLGIDTRHVRLVAGETQLVEILLDPEGERTIVFSASHVRPAIPVPANADFDAAYINARAYDEAGLAALESLPLVVAQFPLSQAMPMPATVVVGSRADLAPRAASDLWPAAERVTGGRAEWLVLTDGPGPVTVTDGRSEALAPVPRRLDLPDMTGAGDCFAAGLVAALAGRSALDIGLLLEAAGEANAATARLLADRDRVLPPVLL
ncbi:sugar/nucleoside kinase (ribokinase family) [Pseudochelatococcus lubricantis]|uniref:Sugar/nucleoside kinase (Ribokinase family) n=1 Tax=Pseudochelatococcus lubricantis TaxID=1538102 RepID=A0ABX0UZG1_9HYPH|nr:PfkB family carbohydrate kinase [Pseudochelatococcus lubricantis]NIJ58352.1 sugar/nucleoside kinase (ribokinase family) [Pseudochelatococcus lubricantis]